eukprot:c14904_g1_i1.p1 GENE.c14904_g1_i1~~c14904_g1_i1.p1  ORF type:complete len:356 (-),score=115.52 c14904_g1_i1:62-1129(-)
MRADNTTEKEKSKKLLLVHITLVIVYIVLNLVFNLFNKWLLRDESKGGAGFKLPIFATWTSALGMFIVALAMTMFPSIYTPVRIKDAKGWLTVIPVSLFYAAGVSLTNTSLVYLPLHTQQIIRSTGPIVVALCAYVVEGKRYSYTHIAWMLILVLGVVLVVATTLDLSMTGFFLCFASVINTALHYTFISLNMSAKALKGMDLLLYTSLPAVCFMLPVYVIADEPAMLSDFVDSHGWELAAYYVIASTVLAVLYNLTIFTFIKTISAVYLSVVGTFKTVLVVFVSIVVFSEPVTALNATGLGIATTAFCFISYYEYQHKQVADAKKDQDKSSNENDGNKTPTDENVPLLKDKQAA